MLSLRVGFLIYTALSVVLMCVSSQKLSKIINYQYQTQALNNAQATRIFGYHINSRSNDQSWDIQSVEGNNFVFRNAATGLYLGVNYASEGAPVIAGPTPYRWRQILISGSWYQIATLDSQYAILLTGPQDGAPIVLKGASYKGKDTQWSDEPAPLVG
ncbi:hypothetical protein EMPS_06547 [Entomortierella parvispora]|uniref:Ricin B lectin domain-containing protein n=1 Tax=Entomortierella parvispora TaxID=205924 RepID=A0A9P3HCK2_9FUNG|nr:hypothetical protein EMPS_06547 [Entomortierella parvispora]